MGIMGRNQTIKRWGALLTGTYVFLMAMGCSSTSVIDQVPPKTEISPIAGKSIVWGKADLEPTESIIRWQPLADYLARNLNHVGIESGVVKIAPDSESLGRLLASGEVDLVIDSFYPAMIASNYSGASPLAVRITGNPGRKAVFFTRGDSGLKSLADLEGKTIALAEADSTSGFMLPVGHLKSIGMNPREKETPESEVRPDEIGYVAAGDDEVVAIWVLNGKVVAGAVGNETFEDFAKENPGALTILAETESMSSDNVVLARKL